MSRFAFAFDFDFDLDFDFELPPVRFSSFQYAPIPDRPERAGMEQSKTHGLERENDAARPERCWRAEGCCCSAGPTIKPSFVLPPFILISKPKRYRPLL